MQLHTYLQAPLTHWVSTYNWSQIVSRVHFPLRHPNEMVTFLGLLACLKLNAHLNVCRIMAEAFIKKIVRSTTTPPFSIKMGTKSFNQLYLLHGKY